MICKNKKIVENLVIRKNGLTKMMIMIKGIRKSLLPSCMGIVMAYFYVVSILSGLVTTCEHLFLIIFICRYRSQYFLDL